MSHKPEPQPLAWLGTTETDDEESAALARYLAGRSVRHGLSDDPCSVHVAPGAALGPSRADLLRELWSHVRRLVWLDRMPLSMWLVVVGGGAASLVFGAGVAVLLGRES